MQKHLNNNIQFGDVLGEQNNKSKYDENKLVAYFAAVEKNQAVFLNVLLFKTHIYIIQEVFLWVLWLLNIFFCLADIRKQLWHHTVLSVK